jgi:hypothetical protein
MELGKIIDDNSDNSDDNTSTNNNHTNKNGEALSKGGILEKVRNIILLIFYRKSNLSIYFRPANTFHTSNH